MFKPVLQGGGYKTGNMCGYTTGIMWVYKTNHSKQFCAGMTAIRSITRKIFSWKFFTRKLWVYLKKNSFRFWFGFKTHYLQKVIFADLTFIRPITPKFPGGNDFYKTNHSKIHEIRPITPKSDWSYNHPLLYVQSFTEGPFQNCSNRTILFFFQNLSNRTLGKYGQTNSTWKF